MITDHKPKNLPERIETPRLILERLTETHTAAFFEAIKESEENLSRYYNGTLAQKNVPQDAIAQYVRDCISEWDARSFIQLAVIEKDGGRLIGAGSLHHLDWAVPKGRIGYIVRKSAEGKGYATEIASALTRYAFDVLQIKRLEIRTATINPASGKIPRRLGYQFLTVFEKNKASNDGEIWDLEIHVRFDAKGL